MSADALAILYTGPGLSGCMTSVRWVAARATPAVTASRRTDASWRISWSRREGPITLHLGLTHGRSLYRFQSLEDGIQGLTGIHKDRFEREVEFLRAVDGIVFVADSQVEAEERNVEFLKRTWRDLLEVGRSPPEIPVVFQLNKRDISQVRSVEQMKSVLSWSDADEHFETIATEGVGVGEALDVLIDRLLL